MSKSNLEAEDAGMVKVESGNLIGYPRPSILDLHKET